MQKKNGRQEQRDDTPVFQVEHLRIQFTQYTHGLRQQEMEAIHHMDLEVYESELVAVVGASGSGKSLLAHAALGILPYNASVEGAIRYKGKNLTVERIRKLRGREIVMVPQSLSYLDPLQKIGPQIRRGRRDHESRKRLREIFRKYQLDEGVENLYPFQLSGGMNRRVLIAAALMEDPKLVIADEPTPGLDLALARKAMERFRELADMGAAVLVITHDLELALQTADRIVIFYEGCTVETICPADFEAEEGLCHPYTRALWKALYGNKAGRRRE